MKPLPTSGEAVRVLESLDRVCAPLVRGAPLKATASSVGMRINGEGDLVMGLEDGRRITVRPPTPANPTNCTITIRYLATETGTILDALQAWAERREPPLAPDKVADKQPEDGGVSVTSTWIGVAKGKAEGLVYIQHEKADGTPQGGRIGESEVLYSYRPY